MGILHRLASRVKQAVLRRRIRYVTGTAWRRRHREVFRRHPEYARPAPAQIERDHLQLWRQLRHDVRLDTLRICHNTAGESDAAIVPEEVFASEVEPALNRHDEVLLMSNKTLCDRWLPNGVLPRALLRNIDGAFYTRDFEPVAAGDVEDVVRSLSYPVVVKPGIGKGGLDVHMPDSATDLLSLVEGRRDYIVQEELEPHLFFRRFNAHGLNTLRACTYRSVSDNAVHLLNVVLRMGREGKLDNLTQGGLARPLDLSGRLHHYAVDLHGAKYSEHPDSHIGFADCEVIPDFDAMRDMVVRCAHCLPVARLLSFDVALDVEGRWRVVEVNVRHQTVRMSQCTGRPFFGEFTEEIVAYSRQYPRWPLY